MRKVGVRIPPGALEQLAVICVADVGLLRDIGFVHCRTRRASMPLIGVLTARPVDDETWGTDDATVIAVPPRVLAVGGSPERPRCSAGGAR